MRWFIAPQSSGRGVADGLGMSLRANDHLPTRAKRSAAVSKQPAELQAFVERQLGIVAEEVIHRERLTVRGVRATIHPHTCAHRGVDVAAFVQRRTGGQHIVHRDGLAFRSSSRQRRWRLQPSPPAATPAARLPAPSKQPFAVIQTEPAPTSLAISSA